MLARRKRNSRTRSPADSHRPPNVPIDRFLIQFIGSVTIDFSQKTSMARGKYAGPELSALILTFAHHFFRTVTVLRRGSPKLNLVFGDK
jgi:hypothetical protein